MRRATNGVAGMTCAGTAILLNPGHDWTAIRHNRPWANEGD